MNQILSRLVLAAFISQTLGCASILSGTSDGIHVNSADRDAKLYLNDQEIGVGSAATTVKRDQTYTIQAKKQGCETSTVQTGYKFDPVAWAGLLVDLGIISILVVDMGMTGAAWKTDPLDYTVTPTCPAKSGQT
jgi:hypothetical protein